MSFRLRKSELSDDDLDFIEAKYFTRKKKTQYCPKPPRINVFDESDKMMYLPLRGWNDFYFDFPNGTPIEKGDVIKTLKFKGKLLTTDTDPSGRKRDQDVVINEALKNLDTNHTTFIAAYTGFGKTASGTYLMCECNNKLIKQKFKRKTLIVCFSSAVRDQWPDEITKFTNAKVSHITGNPPSFDPTSDVYIIGVKKLVNVPKSYFRDIGTVIIDEAHITTASIFTEALFKLHPVYLIGLSATPDRQDGLDSLIHLYFGPKKEFIFRKETKAFTVYKYQTEYIPETDYILVRGDMVRDWKLVISSLESNEERQSEICDIACSHPKEKIIILSYTNEQSIALHKKLLERKESVELFIGSKKLKDLDRTKRILVAGTKKAGAGLNDPSLTMAIIASDTKDVRQWEGRLRTVNCIVYDIVDNDCEGRANTLEKHYQEREKWYTSKGATIIVTGPRKNIANNSYKRTPRVTSQRLLQPI